MDMILSTRDLDLGHRALPQDWQEDSLAARGY